jgi:hypothetical protein
MASVAEDITQILITLRALEDRMKTLKAMLKPRNARKPNSWILFNQRIDALMKENNTPFPRVGEAKQFASSLKKQKAYSLWTDPEILAERTDWLMGTVKACVVCEENPKDDVTQHRDCIVQFATEENIVHNPVGAWLCASSALRSTTTQVTVVDEGEPRRRGRGRPRILSTDAPAESSLPGAL